MVSLEKRIARLEGESLKRRSFGEGSEITVTKEELQTRARGILAEQLPDRREAVACASDSQILQLAAVLWLYGSSSGQLERQADSILSRRRRDARV